MNNFGEAYKEIVDGIKVPVMTAGQITDDGRRKRIAVYQKRRRFMAVAAAACVFCLCTLGVAAAAGYANSVIRTTESGFMTADEKTAFQNNERKEASYSESGLEDGTQDTALAAGQDARSYDAVEDREAQKQEKMTEGVTFLADEWEEQVFESREAFQDAGLVPAALPGMELLCGEVLSEQYIVCGDIFLLVRIETEGHWFMMDQSYYGGTEGHAASVVYPEGVCNERSYTTGQGYTYTVVDSVCEEGDECRIHAAISIGDYELIVDFSGYPEEEAYSILDSMDLNIYL